MLHISAHPVKEPEKVILEEPTSESMTEIKIAPGVNFINILCANYSYERRFGSFFYLTFVEKSS